jgi:mannose-6-phosphate isomerase-like protein (cupin superfamily)
VETGIKKFAEESEYFFAEGCYIAELSNGADDPGLSIARARLTPGKTTRWHSLFETAERYVILAGSGLVEVGELPATAVRAGDVVLIPPQVRQRITNTCAVDLVFLALCTPPFQQQVYQDLES